MVGLLCGAKKLERNFTMPKFTEGFFTVNFAANGDVLIPLEEIINDIIDSAKRKGILANVDRIFVDWKTGISESFDVQNNGGLTESYELRGNEDD